MERTVDALDVSIIALFSDEPRVGVLEASRRLGVARGTVQARLDRLVTDGVIATWAPTIAPGSLGYDVMAFLTLEIRQDAGHARITRHLSQIPEILEAYTTTGSGDLWCRCVARSNADLQRVIDLVGALDAVVRTSTVIALATQIPHRTAPLLGAAAPTPAPGRPARQPVRRAHRASRARGG